MKSRILVPVLLLAVGCFLFVNSGCGQTSTATTTTTTVISSTQVSAAKTGVLVASGGSSVGSSAGSVGSAAGAKIMSIRTFSGPPDSFFTSLITGSASVDGYLPATTETVGGNMTPYMRLKTAGGSVINGAFLADKKIGKWLTLEVEDIMSAGEGNMPANMTAEVSNYVTRYITYYLTNSNTHPFSDATIFRPVSTEADYMAWMFMYPSIEAAITAQAGSTPGAPSHIYMVTPEAAASDKIGGMEMKMVFAKSATGEISIVVATESNGRPISGTYSGAGNLTTQGGTLEATLSMNFATDGPPSWLKLVGTTETTPAYTVIVNMDPLTMTATGEVRDSSGTRIGTLEGSPTGGKVYIGATNEAFTF